MTVQRPVLASQAQAPEPQPVDMPWAASGGIGGAAMLAVGRWRRRDDEADTVRLRLEPGRVGTPDAGPAQPGAWLAGWLERPAARVNRWRIKP
jgi:hypothetical protein